MKNSTRGIVDTQEVNIISELEIECDLMGCFSKIGKNDDSTQRMKYNAYKQVGEEQLPTIKDYNLMLEYKLKEIGLKEGDYVIKRNDIAIDTNRYTFDNDLKLLLFISELIGSRSMKNSDLWYNTSLKDLEVNCINFNPKNNNSFEFRIYNKSKEQVGFPYATRIEFRFKRFTQKSIEENRKYIKLVIDKLEGLESRIEYVESFMIDRLSNLYHKEKARGIITSFSEFVRKYDYYFYTLNVLKGVYKNVGLKGSYTKWLSKFRTINKLEFKSKTEVREFVKIGKKAMKDYLK